MQTKTLASSLLVVSFTLFGCSNEQPASAENTSTESVTSLAVSTSSVARVDSEQWQALGQLLPAQQIPLSMEVTGRVTERLVKRGDHVTTGQLLIRLDDQDFQLKRNALDASISQLEADLQLAKIDRDRLNSLLQRELISQQDLDQITTRIKSLDAQLTRLAQERALANRQVDYTQLLAPVTGRINQVLVEPGQQVQAGQIILEVIPTDDLIISTQLPASRMANLPQQATLVTPSQSFGLALYEQEPLADQNTGLFQVRYQLAPDQAHLAAELAGLPLGERYPVQFQKPLAVALQKIPASALIDLGQGPHVWTIDNDRAQLTPVNLVRLHNGAALIEPSLVIDALIVRHGVHRLQPNQAVRILND
ncbi:efflux RND transporter periplasmic adaptor subunit [Thiomicrospira cyclica]|uniref:Efflux transporter, RND family, MFP subunit n=1 Tax=Thiomicrospira cyclica (strain DSM 14477 / JCM 11371 / ALM1) TaxID=717773 RepID=F6D8U0_THICA|nr:efflux RND transporter periplasmic adaptor subunit [Thiomicrospira cyclica]AEG31940.1 efflux transporter, RND family, MFP subunit [Thiomicrospira cyclica ALM1]